MVLIRCVSLVLLMLLSAVHAVQAHHDSEMRKHELVVTKEHVVSAKKELHDGFAFFGLGGRKMAVRKDLKRKEIAKEQDIQATASGEDNISGKENKKSSEASLGASQDQLINAQKKVKTLDHSQDSKKLGSVEHSSSSTEKLISHPEQDGERKGDTLEATKEIVNLIHRDYIGMDMPRRKPPINNNVPIH